MNIRTAGLNIGEKINSLEVLGFDKDRTEEENNGSIYFLFRCDCGEELSLNVRDVRSGKVKSCGCIDAEIKTNKIATQSIKETSIYKTWIDMKDKCRNPSYKYYEFFGAKGVDYVKEWEDFDTFLNDMGWSWTYDSFLYLKDWDKDFSFENCRWGKRKNFRTWAERAKMSNNFEMYNQYKDYFKRNLKQIIEQYNEAKANNVEIDELNRILLRYKILKEYYINNYNI